MENRADVNPETRDYPAAAPRRKWALTQDAFDKLLDAFAPDREGAGKKYLEVRGNLIRFFEWRGSPSPEDHADETINRVARRIAEGEEVRDPAHYSIGVARMLLLEVNKERAKEHRALGEMAYGGAPTYQFEELEPRVECLRRCMQTLSPVNREMILQYYQGEKGAKIENRKKLTDRFQIPLNTLRMRTLRLREKLQVCVENCLKN
jgi:DNA-directed RNA polymerase specialized sigma24 family protein